MWSWHSFWLWLHILSAIIAFGPTFAYPLIGAQIAKSPQNAVFGVRVMETISMRLTLPFAVVGLPVAGIALILTGQIDFFGTTWLLIAVGLYIVALIYSIGVQMPTGMKLMHKLEAMPPGPPPEGAGPPPEIAALTKRLQMGGVLLTLLFLTIFTLMIFKPGGTEFSG